MPLADTLNDTLRRAIKDRDTRTADVVRMLKTRLAERTTAKGFAGPVTDALVTDAVNAHQRRDKGFGPALGPTATHVVERLFRERGYHTETSASDWMLGPSDGTLVDALVEGWARAAAEERPADVARVRAWAARRGSAAERGAFTLRVGHRDVLALPSDAPQP